MNHSTPGLTVHHQLLESTQTHVHRVGDAIQLSHPLLSPSPRTPNPSQNQGLFQWVNSSHEVAKILAFQLQHQSFQWTPRTGLLQDGLAGSPCLLCYIFPFAVPECLKIISCGRLGSIVIVSCLPTETWQMVIPWPLHFGSDLSWRVNHHEEQKSWTFSIKLGKNPKPHRMLFCQLALRVFTGQVMSIIATLDCAGP